MYSVIKNIHSTYCRQIEYIGTPKKYFLSDLKIVKDVAKEILR